MRERTEQMIHSMNKNRHKRRRIKAFITALAVLTGGNVFWELRETGMAVTEDDLCTMEAHEHSDNCYDSDGTLICGMDEHIHTADCYSDAEADTETPEVWEMSFTAPENAARQEQAALIAESQLGYTESTDNFIFSENGVKQGYTRYGEWYGNPYGDWNTMFTYFCMYYAGVSAEEFPYGGNATTWQAKLKESELLHSPDSEPQRGNIILLDTDADGEADLTGIITDTEELLTVIEGDCDNTVAELKYQYNDSQILGYVSLPEPDTPAEAEAVSMEFSAESPSGIQVSASAEKGTFPEDAVMTVSDISREEAMQAAENLESQTIDAVAVDITFTDAEGTELEPAEDKTVQVQITLPDEMKLSGDEYSLLHISDEGDVQKVEEAEVSENGAEFEAEGFSMYVLTSNQPVDINNAIMLNGNAGNNSADNPFVIGVGETIEVRYDGADYSDCNFTVVNNNYNDNIHRLIRDTTPRKVGEHTYDGYDHYDYGYRTARWIGSTISQPSDNCYIALQKNGKDIEKIYVKVVNNPVFIMDGDKRVLLESNTITRNVGDTFTLSLNGYNAYEIARKENVDSNTAYDYSEYLYRGQPDYSRGDGNTYVDFVCKAATGDTPQTITVNGRTLNVNINYATYMIMSDGRKLLLDDALIELNKSNVRTIYAVEGESFTLSITKKGGANDLLASNDYGTTNYDVNYFDRTVGYSGDNTNLNTNVTFTCKKSTDDNGTILHNVNGEDLRVIIKHPIYVKTNIMDRDIDRVNEWVSTQDWLPKKNGYVPNSFNYYPYQLYDNDTIAIHTPISNLTSPQFLVADSDKLELISTETKNGILYATYKAHNTTNEDINTTIQLKDGNDVIRTMHVRIPKNNGELLDHADIEIADGGKYTLTKIERHNDGSFTKTVTEYKAYVNGVNNSKLYKNANETCQFYKTENNVLVPYDSSVTGYTEEQYWVDPTIKVGSPQYEFTSKYNLQTGDWSNTKYYADDVDHVVFDVKIALEPSKKTVYTKNSNSASWGEGVPTEITATPENIKYLNSVKFNMDHQDVLDAFNKCPNHTGLDFTIMAYSAMVEFDLNKELTGGTVAENQFTFEVLEKEVILARKFAGMNYTLTKSKYNEMSEKGMNFKGAYRIFYDQDTKWGEGIDKDAALRELSTLSANPLFNGYDLSNTAAIFNLANSDRNDEEKARQAIVLRILQQYLTNPAESLIETTDEYEMPSDGFYLLSFESEPIQTVQNDADGHITFNALHFEKEDSYKYIIREKVPENTNNILYDRKELDLDITVSKNDKQLTADITSDMTNFKFTNHTTYRLPDTGSKGVIPYIVVGTAMMGAALMLLHRKRKEA